MNIIKSWLEDLAFLPDMGSNRRWFSVRCTHSCITLDGSDLVQALSDAGALSGWLQTAGEVVWLDNQNLALSLGSPPLAAELYDSDTCWQLNSLPRGRWQLDRHELGLDSEEPTHLARKITQLSIQPGRQLMYWQLWQPGTDQAPECRAAVLRSIEESRA